VSSVRAGHEPLASRSEVVRAAYNPPRWLRAGFTFRCEGINGDGVVARGHDDIRRGQWFYKHPRAIRGEVTYARACSTCGLAIIARSNGSTAYFPTLSRASALDRRRDASRRSTDEARDLARCNGERRLLAELMLVAFRDLQSPHRARVLAWFEGAAARFTFAEVASYLALDAESLRSEAERRRFDKGSGSF
jgi:hypothetical protein